MVDHDFTPLFALVPMRFGDSSINIREIGPGLVYVLCFRGTTIIEFGTS